MEKIKQQLAKDFRNLHSENFDNNTATFEFHSDWRGQTPGVSQVLVWLCGKDPLTGKDLPREGNGSVVGRYSAGSVGDTVKAPFYGDFLLRFDAVLDDGRRIEDFIEPERVKLEVRAKKPRIEYRVSNARYGFARLDFEGTNCWQNCNGKLWIKNGKTYQRLPKLPDRSKVCYVPTRESFVILADQGLPKPKLKDKD